MSRCDMYHRTPTTTRSVLSASARTATTWQLVGQTRSSRSGTGCPCKVRVQLWLALCTVGSYLHALYTRIRINIKYLWVEESVKLDTMVFTRGWGNVNAFVNVLYTMYTVEERQQLRKPQFVKEN